MAEGAPLLRVYTLIAYRGFESLSLRHIQRTRRLSGFLCLAVRDENPIEGSISCETTDNERSEARRVRTGPSLFELIPLSPPYIKIPDACRVFYVRRLRDENPIEGTISCETTDNERSEARRVRTGPRLLELTPLSPPY